MGKYYNGSSVRPYLKQGLASTRNHAGEVKGAIRDLQEIHSSYPRYEGRPSLEYELEYLRSMN